ncbi:hypothetical protein [uncultured Polaribacter sp.]|uniref:hypothetical protein n=1 Tax=uncultured Polaribacter sp. TaxID=174711 RepID=UPI002627D9D8|nr:hypothetical protein [uncultured Polaribacter sp.]
MFFKKNILLVLMFVCISCSKNETLFEEKTENINLAYTIDLKDKKNNILFDFGIWMFKNKEPNQNGIANWLNIPHQNKEILEPINVLWIDLKSKNEEEATNAILFFLKQNGLAERKGSSTGYATFFEDYQWKEQYRETWSDKQDPITVNNHGRIFVAHKTKYQNQDKDFFVSTGAFSIEDEQHLFVSFKEAQEQFKVLENWRLHANALKVGNIINTNNISTFDREGVKVFILK